MNLGVIYKDIGKLDQALASTLKSLEINPDNPDAYKNLGGIYKDLGKLDQAVASTRKSLEINPNNSITHMNLGVIYQDLGKLDQAIASILKSLEINSTNPTANVNLGNIYCKLKDYANAVKYYTNAYHLKPSIENKCLAKLILPWHFTSQDEVRSLRLKYLANAAEIFTEECQGRHRFLNLSLFPIAYQNGSDDKYFLEKIGELVSPWLQIPSERKIGIPGKLHSGVNPVKMVSQRVGFYFDNTEKSHVVFRHYFNIVKSCHQRGIEIVLIKGPDAAKQYSAELESQASLVVQLYSNLDQSVRTLRNLNLQMLVYTEIYSSNVPYCLAHNRIAPIQVVLPGNLITTGLPTIDFFVSSEHMETENSFNQYTEQLIKLKGMPHGITDVPNLNPQKNRGYFQLPENSHILACSTT